MTLDVESDGARTTVTLDTATLADLLKRSRHTVKVDAERFGRAIAAIVPHASEDPSSPGLHRVRIHVGPDYLDLLAHCGTTAAVMRVGGYALMVEDHDHSWYVDVSPPDLTMIGKLFKPAKDEQMTLRIDVTKDGRVTFTDASGLDLGVGRAYTVPIVGAHDKFPDVRSLLLGTMNYTHGIVGCVTYSGKHLKRFAASTAALGLNAVIEPTNANRPFVVTIGDEFVGALQPVKSDDVTERADAKIRDEWRDRLGARPAFTVTPEGDSVNTETGEVIPAGDGDAPAGEDATDDREGSDE